MTKRILYIVDFQRDFVVPDGILHVGGAENLIPLMERFLSESICVPNGILNSVATRDEFFEKVKELGYTIDVCGVASDYCVRFAVNGLLARGHKVRIIEDLTKGIALDIRAVAQEEGWNVEWTTSGEVVTYEAVLASLDTHIEEEYMGSLENIGVPEKGIPGFPLHCEKGTKGHELVFDINVLTIEKGVFDVWAEDNQTIIKV